MQGHGSRDCPLGDPFFTSAQDITDASRWPRGTLRRQEHELHQDSLGRARYLESTGSPAFTLSKKHTTSTTIEEIRHRVVWHLVVAWYLYTHVATSSESLAESVGSFLRALTNRNSSGRLHRKRMVWGAQLKAAGLRGLGGEEGVLAMALNTHFKSQGPEGWRFSTKKPSDASRWRRPHASQVASHWQRLWSSDFLLDLVRSGRTQLCKSSP